MTTKSDNIPKFAGVDVGSLTTKSMIISNSPIAGYSLIPTGLEDARNYSGKV